MSLDPLRGAVVWITGVPASGKTTLARGLRAALLAAEIPTLWLDSDDLRPVLVPRADYGEAGRDAFYAALAHLVRLGGEGGVTVLVSATASLRRYRDAARAVAPRFFEVFLECGPVAVRARDFKGLYAAADEGRISSLPGVGAPYEPPLYPEVRVDTDGRRPEEVLAATLSALRSVPIETEAP